MHSDYQEAKKASFSLIFSITPSSRRAIFRVFVGKGECNEGGDC